MSPFSPLHPPVLHVVAGRAQSQVLPQLVKFIFRVPHVPEVLMCVGAFYDRVIYATLTGELIERLDRRTHPLYG